MTVRSRLLLLLLPPLTAFLMLISFFFYVNWSREILNGFKSRLQSIVVTTSQNISSNEIEWLIQHIHNPDINLDPTYQIYRQQLASLKQKLPVANISIVQIGPNQEINRILTQGLTHSDTDEAHHSSTAYRQLILLDIGESKKSTTIQPGEYSPSETDEYQVYTTKKTYVTPIYETRTTHERLISAFAPILNGEGEVLALLRADVSMKEIDQKLDKAWLIILMGSCITLLLVVITVFLIADRISKPIRQLNQAALEIAAGDYEANIKVKGPKEIVELAHTLNTMSECLVEHMSRLRESSLIRERMYGEYECALLLQHYMLQKVIEEFHHSAIRMRLISMPLSPLQKGLFLKVERPSNVDLDLTLLEAQDQGFTGLFQLNQWAYLPKEELKNKAFIECQFMDHYKFLRYDVNSLFPPLVWSIKSQQFIKGDHQKIPLHNRDMIFLYSSSLIEQFKTKEAIEGWFARVLRHFSEDGLDTIYTMLTNELTFLAKKQQAKRSFKIIGLQLNLNEAP